MTYSQENIDAIAANIATRIPSHILFSEDVNNTVGFQMIPLMMENVSQLVKALNGTCGTHAKKSITSLRDILSGRGIWCESPDSCRLSVTLGGCRFSISYNKGIDMAVGSTAKGYMYKPIFHCTASEEDIANLIECIAAVEAKALVLLAARRSKARQEAMISEVEFPLVEQMVRQALEPRGIRYSLTNLCGKNILRIQIVKHVWMRKNVCLDELACDLDLVPFLIKRPECVKADGKGFTIYHDYDWR